MFRPSGLFDDLMCPDNNCSRRQCMFWHSLEPQPGPSAAPVRTPSPQYNPAYPAQYYSRPPAQTFEDVPQSTSFFGYNGVVTGAAPSTSSIYAPVDPHSGDYNGFVGYSAAQASSSSSISFHESNTQIPAVPEYSDVPSSVMTPSIATAAYTPTPIMQPPVDTLNRQIRVKQEPVEEDDITIIEPPPIALRIKTSPPGSPERFSPPGQILSKTGKIIKSLPLPKVGTSRNTNAAPVTNVAQIDAEIQRLMKLREQAASSSASSPICPDPLTLNPKLEAISPQPQISPQDKFVPPKPASVFSSVIGYTPTPLEDIKRQKEKERHKAAKAKAAEEKTSKKRTQVDVKSLFGDDDDSDDDIPMPVKRRRGSEDHSDIRIDAKPLKVVSMTKFKEKHLLTKDSASKSSSGSSILKSLPKTSACSVSERASVSRSSRASSSPERVEKGKGLTAEQIAAARLRTARAGASGVVRPLQTTTRRLPSVAEQMNARMQTAQKEREAAAAKAKLENNVKKPLTMEQMYGQKRTGIQSTAAKGELRAARTTMASPSSSSIQPQLIEPTNHKIPIALRSRSLSRIFEEARKFLPLAEAVEQAQLEEKAILDKVSHKLGYANAVPNAISRLRGAAAQASSKKTSNAISHQRVLIGRGHDRITIGANGPKPTKVLNEQNLYEAAEHYLLTEQQLKGNSYPHFIRPGRVFIEPSIYDKKKVKKPFVPDYEMDRVCCRCAKEFALNAKGTVVPAECVYHLRGKARLPGMRRLQDSIHPCCGGDASVAGCQVATAHVSDTLRDSELNKFVTAPQPQGKFDSRSRKVLAMDCEMVYSVWGPALARVTVVDLNEEVVLDEIVKPDHAIIDYNTTFSGITAKDLDTATCTLKTAQERLFELINTDSILIGHSLESDLKAMRIVHDRVVDTAIMYPHRTENDKKRSLKELALDRLGKSIQEDVGGHDSKEDSLAALLLVIHKARYDGWL